MGIIRTYFAGRSKLIAAEAHWAYETAIVVRPQQIKLKAAQQLLAVTSAVEADPKLGKVFASLKLSEPGT